MRSTLVPRPEPRWRGRALPTLLALGCCGALAFAARSLQGPGMDPELAHGIRLAESMARRVARGDVERIGPLGASARSLATWDESQRAGPDAAPFAVGSKAFIAYDQSGVPCFGDFSGACGPIGPGVEIAIPFPRSTVTVGEVIEWDVLIETNGFSGNYTVVVLLFQNGATVDFDFMNGTASANSAAFASFRGKTVPAVLGPTILVSVMVDELGTTLSTAYYRYEVL